MFATIIKIEREDPPNNHLFSVKVKEPYLLFFSETTTYKHLTKPQVQKLRVPFGMFSFSDNVDYDCVPNRFT
jgi:hypothetical protein